MQASSPHQSSTGPRRRTLAAIEMLGKAKASISGRHCWRLWRGCILAGPGVAQNRKGGVLASISPRRLYLNHDSGEPRRRHNSRQRYAVDESHEILYRLHSAGGASAKNIAAVFAARTSPPQLRMATALLLKEMRASTVFSATSATRQLHYRTPARTIRFTLSSRS